MLQVKQFCHFCYVYKFISFQNEQYSFSPDSICPEYINYARAVLKSWLYDLLVGIQRTFNRYRYSVSPAIYFISMLFFLIRRKLKALIRMAKQLPRPTFEDAKILFIYFISIFILLTRRKATEALMHRIGNYPPPAS